MTSSSPIKEELYLRRAFDEDVPVFVDVTRYLQQGTTYPLTTKKALKATCGVWTDDEVVAFSLRDFTARQAEREVETVADTVGGTAVTQRNVLRPRIPRKTLHQLNQQARTLSAILGGNDVIVELDGDLHHLTLTRTHNEGEPKLTGGLSNTEDRHTHRKINNTEAEFKLPLSGVRLRIFLRSPIRQRLIAYAFGGYPPRKPGEIETVTRATAHALNTVLGLATFRILTALDHVEVAPTPAHPPIRPRPPAQPLIFTVPVLLLTDTGAPAAQGDIVGQIDLERLDPVTGRLGLEVSAGDHLEWNPKVAGPVRFETYRHVLTQTLTELISTSLGTCAMRDIGHAIILGDLGHATIAGLRTAIADLPALAATPTHGHARTPHT